MSDIEINKPITSIPDNYTIASFDGGKGYEITFSNFKNLVVGENKVIVNQDNAFEIFSGSLSSTVLYFIDGVIDLTGLSVNIEVPATGVYLAGYNFDLSGIVCSDASYQLFTSPLGGSGNILINNMYFQIDGTNSSVYALESLNGFQTIEVSNVNFNSCTSLGYINNYRQALELGTGRFGGTPELEFRGAWNGVRISTSIVRSVSLNTSLFKAGTGLVFSGRFFTDINCDLPAIGSLIDFSDSNFTNDESLKLDTCLITRNGLRDPTDTTIVPNIDQSSVKSKWKNNVGLKNTNKLIEARITSETATVISATNTYYPLGGTFSVTSNSHFDMPANGQFRLLSGNGTYSFFGDLPIAGTASDEVDIRVAKSTDGGSTFPTEINHIKRTINNLSGGRNVAFFSISFSADLTKDDRVRLEIENKTATNNVTAEIDSYFIIKEV